jgi:mono/diheme cytochrome c family protein
MTQADPKRHAHAAFAPWALLLALLSPAVAHADDRRAAPLDAVYAAECGSCHLAYPPRLLSAASWARLMKALDRHFGTDASVDPDAFTRIDRYLRDHVGPERKFGTTALRISETAWFAKKHGEVPTAVWKHPAVRSTANCAACHRAAEQGDYGERNIRLPRP